MSSPPTPETVEIQIPRVKWDCWQHNAQQVEITSSRMRLWTISTMTAAAIALSWLLLEPPARYSALVYSPLLGYATDILRAKLHESAKFRSSADEMKTFLVPALLVKIDTHSLATLAANDGVNASGYVLRATRGDAIVTVNRTMQELQSSGLVWWIYRSGAANQH